MISKLKAWALAGSAFVISILLVLLQSQRLKNAKERLKLKNAEVDTMKRVTKANQDQKRRARDAIQATRESDVTPDDIAGMFSDTE